MRPEQQRCAARLREQTRPPRGWRFGRCRRRSRSGTSLSPDARNPRTCRRDTRPCTTGLRLALRPASAQSKRELLGTRDARDPYGQGLRQPEKVGISKSAQVFSGSLPPDRGSCGISPGGAENSPVRFWPSRRNRTDADAFDGTRGAGRAVWQCAWRTHDTTSPREQRRHQKTSTPGVRKQ